VVLHFLKSSGSLAKFTAIRHAAVLGQPLETARLSSCDPSHFEATALSLDNRRAREDDLKSTSAARCDGPLALVRK
jgi:hypothetical protein